MSACVQIGVNYHLDPGVVVGYPVSRKIKDYRTVLGHNAIIRAGSIIYQGVRIGDNLETGHNVIIREENRIGHNFRLWNNSTIDYGCIIGNNVRIHNNVYVAQYTVLEDEVFLAPGVITANDPHPICGLCMRGPTIKKGAKIGINSTILPYVTIGEYALIGAGSVVTQDIPPRSVAVGNPARVIKTITELACKHGFKDTPYPYMTK